MLLMMPILLWGQKTYDKDASIFSMGVEHFNQLVAIQYVVDSTDEHIICEKQYLTYYVEHIDDYLILDTNCFWIIESAHYIHEYIMPHLNNDAAVDLLNKYYPRFNVNNLLSNPKHHLYSHRRIMINSFINYDEIAHHTFLVVLAPLNVYLNYLCFFTEDRIPGVKYPDYKKSKIFSEKSARGIYVKILLPIGEDE